MSVEPLLGEIDILKWILACDLKTRLIDGVIVGAESGHNRRECKIEWIENIVEQCKAARVPCFVKQIHLNGKLITDLDKFPKSVKVRELAWG